MQMLEILYRHTKDIIGFYLVTGNRRRQYKKTPNSSRSARGADILLCDIAPRSKKHEAQEISRGKYRHGTVNIAWSSGQGVINASRASIKFKSAAKRNPLETNQCNAMRVPGLFSNPPNSKSDVLPQMHEGRKRGTKRQKQENMRTEQGRKLLGGTNKGGIINTEYKSFEQAEECYAQP
jgi:hypothetical protein